MKIKTLIILLIFIIGCGNYVINEIPFETIDKGINSIHKEKKEYVITNQKDWEDLWNNINSNINPNIPEINFNNEIIIVVFQGEKNTGGYDIEIISITEKEDVEVNIREIKPNPEDFVTQVITSPYHIVKIDKIEKDIIFFYS